MGGCYTQIAAPKVGLHIIVFAKGSPASALLHLELVAVPVLVLVIIDISGWTICSGTGAGVCLPSRQVAVSFV